MARSRILKIGFFENEVLAQLPDKARLLYAGLWLIADRAGRLEDRPTRIRAQIFPYEAVDCEALLDTLSEAGFVRRYECDGIKVVDLPSFLVHQSPHHREPESKLPVFSQSLGSAQALPGLGRDEPQPSPPDPVSLSVSVSVSDRVDGAEPASPPSSPPVLVFDVTGKGVKSWPLTAEYLADLQRDYEHLDVLAECKKASAWLKANPGRKKTAKGMPAFLVKWLNRAVDSGRSALASVRVMPRRAPVRASVAWYDDCTHEPRCPSGPAHWDLKRLETHSPEAALDLLALRVKQREAESA